MLGWIISLFNLFYSVYLTITGFLSNLPSVIVFATDFIDGIHDLAHMFLDELHSPITICSFIFMQLAVARIFVSFWGKGGGS